MGDVEFRVYFDNPHETFGPGELVSGKIILNILKAIKVKEIRVKIAGEGHVEWNNSNSSSDLDTRPDNYRKHETFFETKYVLETGIDLNIGQRSYNFNHMLPDDLPTSFEGSRGHIRYFIKCTLDIPWKSNHRFAKAFTVIAPVDLNRLEQSKVPLNVQKNEETGPLRLFTGKMAIELKSPFSGYAPGQKIPLEVAITNSSGSEISKSALLFFQKLKYIAIGETKKEEVLIKELSIGKIKSRENKRFASDIPVPSLPPSNPDSKIIQITYFFKIQTSMSGLFKRGMDLKVPLIIGSFPLAPSHTFETLPSRNPIEKGVGWLRSLSSIHPQLPLPAYEPCLVKRSEKTMKKDKLSLGAWVPCYLVYRGKS